MSTGTTKITPSQAKFLSQTVDEVYLSVRASNCLKNINVKHLGELVQYSPVELMRVHNFGRKSLDEIVELFAKENLSLGLSIPGWTPEHAGASVSAVDSPQSSAGLDQLQCAFLAKRLDAIDLSVRTSNCLNTLKIKYLGELVQYTPAELLRIYTFGKKSLEEVKEVFAQMNLSLGLKIANWTPDFVSFIADEDAGAATNGVPVKDWLTPTQKAFLAQDLSQFHLSKRVAAIVQAGGIARVGDLAIRPVDKVKTFVGSDQTALRELSGLLASEQLHFGVAVLGWSAGLAADWQEAYPAETDSIRGRHAIARLSAPASGLPQLEDELENLVRQTLKGASDRNVSIVVRFFGFDGTGKKTLEEVGQKFEVTRERVRQITSRFSRRLHGRSLYLPIFRLACNHILEGLPNSPSTLGQSLQERKITRTNFDISSIVATLRLLDEDDLFDVVPIKEAQLAVEKDKVEYFKRIPRIARAIVSAFGCGHIEHILADLETGPECTFSALDVANVLDRNPDVRWLGHEHQWFTIVETKRNRLSNIIRKVLSVSQEISLSELRGAIKRVHRLDGFAPPSDILKTFCSSLPFCDVIDEHIVSNHPLSIAETLGEIEHCFYDVLREHGPVLSSNALRDECLKRGMNANSFYQYITYSPIICRLVREVYALVGADVQPGVVEDILQPAIRSSVLVGHGWTVEGRIWISYRLNASNVRSGVFSLPSALKELVSGNFSIQSSGTGSRSIILAEGDRLTGLHRPIAIRGGQPDDVIVVTFDLRHESVELRFEDETEDTKEVNAESAAPISVVASAASQDRRTLPITGSDLTGGLKEWQPISAAPVEQDLEVRLEDHFGRYVLLFPCRFVLDQGWINSRLETSLPADPVDWRNWDESSLRF